MANRAGARCSHGRLDNGTQAPLAERPAGPPACSPPRRRCHRDRGVAHKVHRALCCLYMGTRNFKLDGRAPCLALTLFRGD
eukprot:223505-Prymnesium_polylepis.1